MDEKPCNNFPPELEAACKERKDLSAISSLYSEALQADNSQKQPLLLSMALLAASGANAPLLDYCFSQGLILNPKSVNPPLIIAALSTQNTRPRDAPALEVFEVLLRHGWDPSQHLETSTSVLAVAAQDGDMGLASLLLSHGADPNGRGVWTPQPLAEAVGGPCSSQEMLELLLKHGAKVRGTSALAVAAECGNREAVERLLATEDVDLEETGQYSYWPPRKGTGTPLYKAAEGGHKDVFRMLIKAGAKKEFRDGSGRSIRDMAEANGLEWDEAPV